MMKTIFVSNLVRLDHVNMHQDKLFGTKCTLRFVQRINWRSHRWLKCWVKDSVLLIVQFVGAKLICRSRSACVLTLTLNMRIPCLFRYASFIMLWFMASHDPTPKAFRAEVPITEIETRRDHWNKVIAQQMIPKEGRVSHISFEHDRKQAARRYYNLRTTIIDSMHDYTNIITIASQPPAWFFSPKELTQPLRECLREVNYCDNSFSQESFVTNPDIVELKLRHQDFLKHRDQIYSLRTWRMESTILWWAGHSNLWTSLYVYHATPWCFNFAGHWQSWILSPPRSIHQHWLIPTFPQQQHHSYGFEESVY